MTEDEMVGWHHWLSGHEFEQAPGDGEGQGRLVCCSPWGHKESDTTEQQRSHGSVFLVRSTHPGSIHAPTKTHFIRTKAAVEISRDLGCLCKLLRSLPFLSNYKEFRSSVSKKKRKDDETKPTFLSMSQSMLWFLTLDSSGNSKATGTLLESCPAFIV